MYNVFLIGFLIFFTIKMHAQNLELLETKIDSIFHSIDGDFAIAFKSLDEENISVFNNEKMIFHAASTMKTPVMIEVYKQAAGKKFALDDSVEIKIEFKSIVDGSTFSMNIIDDSGEELYKYIGKHKTVRELVHEMITVSSNLATNILIDLAGAKNVTETLRTIGANDIQVLRGVEDEKAFNLGLNNVVTAFDLMLIYEHLAKRKFINVEASNKMIEILLQQKHKSRIPAKLPPTVKVAHKTGSITGVGHDSGIIFLPDGRKYILVLLSKKVKDEIAAMEAQAEVSKMIYDYMMKH